MVLVTFIWLKTEIKILFWYKIVQLQKMSLYNVKIKVSTENFEKGSHQRKRCVVAGEIDSIYDIFLAVRKNFGPVELTEIYYKGQFSLYFALNI